MVLQYYSGKRLIIVISCHSDNRPSQICDKNDKFCSIRLYSKWTDLSCWMVFDSRNRSMLLKNFHLSLFLLFCYFVFILWDSIIVNILKFCMPIFLTKWHMQTVQTQIRLLLQSDLGLFFLFGFYSPYKYISLILSWSFIKGGRKRENPGKSGSTPFTCIRLLIQNSNTEWQAVQVQISWLLKKPTDLDLHCLQRQGISGFSRRKVKFC